MKKFLTLLSATAIAAASLTAIEWGDSGATNLAKGATVTVSSTREGNAADITDGNVGTSWSAQPSSNSFTGTDWAILDLGEVKSLNFIEINWRNNHAAQFSIYLSEDAIPYTAGTDDNAAYNKIDESWLSAHTANVPGTATDETAVCTTEHSFDTTNAQYILIYADKRNGFGDTYGMGIFEVYAGLVSTSTAPASLQISSKNAFVDEPATVTVSAFTAMNKEANINEVDGLTLTCDNPAVTITPVEGSHGQFTVSASAPGYFTLTATGTVNDKTLTATATFISEIDWTKTTNLATGKEVLFRYKSDDTIGKKAVDGNDDTNYEYDGEYGGGDSWIVVDLGEVYSVDAIGATYKNGHGSVEFGYALDITSLNSFIDENVDRAWDKNAISDFTYLGTMTRPATGNVTRVLDAPATARYILVRDAVNPSGKPKLAEIQVSGEKFSTDIDGIALLYNDVEEGQSRPVTVMGVKDGRFTGELPGATITLKDVTDTDKYYGEVRLAENGSSFTGVKHGLCPAVIEWKIDETHDYKADVDLEVTIPDWTNTWNIARIYRSTELNAIVEKDNGMVLTQKVDKPQPDGSVKEVFERTSCGNPSVKVSAKNTRGDENQNLRGLVDGDWMAWSIFPDEISADAKPEITIDLGHAFPIDEFDIHWNANGDGQGNGDYRNNACKYTVLASTDNAEWTEIYNLSDRPDDNRYIDRHVFAKGEYRYVKFVFNGLLHNDIPAVINEITITGPDFINGGEFTSYPEANVLYVTTPGYDRSNAADRSVDDDWIVTSMGVPTENKLALSYLAVDCYGRPAAVDGQHVELRKLAEDGTLTDPGLSDPFTVKYRDIEWEARRYAPAQIGSEQFVAVYVDAEGKVVPDTPQSAPFTVHTISDYGNVNRYAYAYDNAVNYTEDWATQTRYTHTQAGTAVGDRDLSATGTSPQNAADGNYGSWYVIGYYSPADDMGGHYKYPANYDLSDHPWELVMDYRGQGHENDNYTTRFASELHMLGLKYEGAFPASYKVYMLQCDDEGKIEDVNKWVEIADFTGMRNMGIGQTETHRIFNRNYDGTGLPKLDENGKIVPWTNVVAVKIQFLMTGTEYGIKMFESAIYGKLNKAVIPMELTQATFSDVAGTTPFVQDDKNKYYSFDLNLRNIDDPAYANTERLTIEEALKNADHYEISLQAQKIDDTWVNDPMTVDNAPISVSYNGETVESTLSDDGVLTFSVPAPADHSLLSGVTIHSADPSKFYIAGARVFDSNNELIKEIEIDASKRTALVAPATKLVPTGLAITPSDEEIDADNAVMDNDRQAAATGSAAHSAPYHKGNVASVKGYYEPIKVTNDVAANWNVAIESQISIEGRSSDSFTVSLPQTSSPAVSMGASLNHVSLATTETKATEAVPGLDGATTDPLLLNAPISLLDPEASFDVTATTRVHYSRGARAGESAVANSKANLDQSEIIEALTPEEGETVEHQAYLTAAADGKVSNDWHLRANIKLQTPNVNGSIGFLTSSADHYKFFGDEAEKDGLAHGGAPLAASEGSDFGMKGFSPWSEDAYVHATNNAGLIAYDNSSLSFDARHMIVLPEDKPREYKVTIPVLLTYEYPIILNGRTLSVTLGGNTVTAPAAAAAAGDATLQAPMVARYIPVNVDFSEILTGIADVATDAAPARYFNLNGIEIARPEPGQFVIELRDGKATKYLVK